MPGQLARIMLVLVAVSFLGGCVAQGKLDRYRNLYRTSQEQIVDLESQLEEARSRIQALEQAKSENPELQQRIDELKQQRDELRQALADAKEQLQQRQAGPGDLPPQVNQALRRLADNNPELTFVEEKGMVKFATDFTFDLGSAEVSNEGEQTVQDVAQVLQQSAAKPFEIRIVGHTDAVPISKPSTKAKHPTNWHLSVHRAIAIEEVLENAGVQAERMGVAGYGPYRPIEPHGEDGRNKTNRRVELYLVQRGEGAGVPAGASEASGGNGSNASTAPQGEGQSEQRSKSGGSNSGSDSPAMYK